MWPPAPTTKSSACCSWKAQRQYGFEVTILARAQDISAYAGYVRTHGLVRPAAKAVKPETPPEVTTPPKPNVFDTVGLDGIMAYPLKALQTWVAAHAAELTEHDVTSMIIWENDQKKSRVNLVKGLKVLFGGA